MLGHSEELLCCVLECCSTSAQNTGDYSWNVKHFHSVCLMAWLPSCGALWGGVGHCRFFRRQGFAGRCRSISAGLEDYTQVPAYRFLSIMTPSSFAKRLWAGLSVNSEAEQVSSFKLFIMYMATLVQSDLHTSNISL